MDNFTWIEVVPCDELDSSTELDDERITLLDTATLDDDMALVELVALLVLLDEVALLLELATVEHAVTDHQ